MKKILILSLLMLSGCEQQSQPVRTYTDDEGVKHEVVREGGGFAEHLAGAAVAGAVGGAAAGAASRATDHAINRWQDRKEERRSRPRTYNARTVRTPSRSFGRR